MSRKFLARLAPLLAIAAFAVVPAMAQAANARWTVNDEAFTGTKEVLNGSKAITLVDPTLKVTIVCEASSKGTITNPTTGNSTDSITSITFFNCKVSGPEGEGCTAAVVAEKLPWATEVNEAGTIDTITGVQVKITLTGTCSAKGTVTYSGTLSDKIANDIVPPTGTPNCKVQTLQSALSGELESEPFKTKGKITGNVYICTAKGEEVGVNDLDKP